MYVESDFLLALVEDAAASVYRDHRDELWTSHLTLVELLLVAYRDDMDAERVVANAAELVEVRGDDDAVVAAAIYVEDHGLTPFDALHLVESNGDTITSSDAAYDEFAPVLDLRDARPEE